MEVDDILNMLDWKNDEETQKAGRQYAKKIGCLNLFIQPLDKRFNKNIWDNCALIISEKEDDELSPYLTRLLDWIQDMNWPGATVIFERLENYRNYEQLSFAIGERVIVANAIQDEIWLSNINELINSGKLKSKISNKLYEIIPRYIE